MLERTPVGRYFGQLVNTVAMLAPLRAALDEDRIDVVCVQEYWTARFDTLARTLRRPVVAVDQGLPDRRELKWLKRGAFAASAGAVVQTEREAEKVRHYGGHARRIPNAVDAEFFSPDPAPAATKVQPEILFVGRLHDAQKRVSDALKALWLLPENWRLTVAGSGPDEAPLRRLADELRVGERVSFAGFVGDSERLRDLYRRADVVAMPSTYEGLPMVLLEAMSCGTPVVGSRIPAIAGVVRDGETGSLFPVGAPDRLASALTDAVADRDRLGDGARRSILADYDQAVVGPRLAEFLSNARDAHARGGLNGSGR
jgi:glycosyltransferase involved in cell wall biosynthesis